METFILNSEMADQGNGSQENQAGNNQSGEHQQLGPPTLADVIARVLNSSGEQTRLLDLLVRNTTPRGRQDVEAGVTYGHFLDTRPPVFTKAEHPLEADEWICTIE